MLGRDEGVREKVQKRLWGSGFQTWHLPTPRVPRTPPRAAGSGINPLPRRPATTHARTPAGMSSATNSIYFLITDALLPHGAVLSALEPAAGGPGPAARAGGAGAGGVPGGGSRPGPAAGGSGGRARRGQHGRRGGSGTEGNPTQRPLLAEAGFWGPQRNPTSPLTPVSGFPPALCRRLPRGGEGRRPAPSRRAGLPRQCCLGRSCPGWGRRKLRAGSGAGPGLRGASPGEQGEAGRLRAPAGSRCGSARSARRRSVHEWVPEWMND